jgi:hypothetical protein
MKQKNGSPSTYMVPKVSKENIEYTLRKASLVNSHPP